jgi:hypothetical protein
LVTGCCRFIKIPVRACDTNEPKHRARGRHIIAPSGIDYFTRLIHHLEAAAARQAAPRKEFPEGTGHAASSSALMKLAEALTMLSPGSRQRLAYNSAREHAATLNLGSSIDEVEQDHFEEYRLSDPAGRDPNVFLAKLIGDMDDMIDDAELNASEDAFDRSGQERNLVDARANEIARGIASKKAEDGAREAAEEAYRLAYEWAYEDIFEEAYQQALSQLS